MPIFAKLCPDLRIVVPAYPKQSCLNDFDPLRSHPGVAFCFVGAGETAPPADLIVLSGSKSVISDLAWLRAEGWEATIHLHLRRGGKLIGVCGGFQMLGQRLNDPHVGEGRGVQGLGLLEMETTYERRKTVGRLTGHLHLPGHPRCAGYEIHHGHSSGPALGQPAATFSGGRLDGAQSADGQIFSTYLHGLFDAPEALSALLEWARGNDCRGDTAGFSRVMSRNEKSPGDPRAL